MTIKKRIEALEKQTGGGIGEIYVVDGDTVKHNGEVMSLAQFETLPQKPNDVVLKVVYDDLKKAD